MEAAIMYSALGDDLSAPKTPTTPTPTNEHERPPEAHTGTKNKQPRANTQVQKLQTLTRCFKPYAFVCRWRDGESSPHPCLKLFYPAYFFPSGGFGLRRYLSRYDSLRVFALWHGEHNHCRLLNSSVPPRAWLMMWSSSKGSPSPQCAHWYGS